jgi:AhpC/TSA family
MSPAERELPPVRAPAPPTPPATHYGRYVGLLGLLIVALITLNTVLTKPNGGSGVVMGQPVPPFASPLAVGNLPGETNVATHANQGRAGKHPACTVRGPEILNICELYERAPVVLALFVDEGSCTQILGELQQLAPAFPDVRFAAVAIKGGRKGVRKLIAKNHITLPVALDPDGILAALYRLSTCPQVSFIYPGGLVQSPALLEEHPAPGTLRARIAVLLAASRARGWKPSA